MKKEIKEMIDWSKSELYFVDNICMVLTKESFKMYNIELSDPDRLKRDHVVNVFCKKDEIHVIMEDVDGYQYTITWEEFLETVRERLEIPKNVSELPNK
jgi:hypothetical protein